MPHTSTITETPWHSVDAEAAIEQLESSRDGLSSGEAEKRLDQFGPNELEEAGGTSLLRLILRQLRSPLIYLLAAAAVVAFVAGEHLDGGVILAVVALNTLLGVVQEYRAERAIEALREMAAPETKVRRGGEEQTIPSRDVVPGDILLLSSGATVAADARLLKTKDLEADESALTGESESVAKSAEAVDEHAALAEHKSMVFSSTAVTRGRGEAVVVATGMNTEVGAIAGEMRKTERQTTPLQERMHRLSLYLGALAVVVALGVLAMGYVQGRDLLEMAMYSIAVAVSAIPEGLPAVISITLAVGVRRMSRRKAILRRLPAVETLGSTTVVCTDKTGTVTQNQMTVVRMWADGRFYSVSGEGYAPEGEIRAETNSIDDDDARDMLLRIGVLNNDSMLAEQDGAWSVDGTPTEGALLTVAAKAGLARSGLEEEHPRQDELPFSSEHKYMATLHKFPERGKLLLVKGAPERLAEFSSHIVVGGVRRELDDETRKRVAEATDEFASRGLRAVAGAWREAERAAPETAEQGLTFAGLWGIMDPPRSAAVEAVELAKKAGMRVILMTGDNATTAAAIAQQAGIAENADTLSGSDIDEMSDDEIGEAIEHTDVFARVSPTHKLRILQALQDKGEIVAMTGDGVNDAPALKGADIGVAMGQAGTEVAREAADMILTDDNFATIIAAVEEGRVIFSNLRRVVYYLLTTNIGEVITFLVALAIGLPLPLTAIMILWINLITDGACVAALGIEPKHTNVLDQPPRPPDAGLIDMVMIRRIALLAPLMTAGTLGIFWYEMDNGEAYAQTIAFTTLAAFQWFQALNARSRYQSIFQVGLLTNRWLLLGIGAAIALQVLTVYAPLGQRFFGTEALTLMDWVLCILIGSTILVADELLKRLKIHGTPERG